MLVRVYKWCAPIAYQRISDAGRKMTCPSKGAFSTVQLHQLVVQSGTECSNSYITSTYGTTVI
eukprot:6489841-Amphidinium_carterae.2